MNTINTTIEPRLQYTYAKINLDTGFCTTVRTMSYEINMAGYILVPHVTDDYMGKYYNQVDGHWYADSQFSIPCPELDW